MTEIALMTAPAGFVPDCVTVNYGNSGTVQRFDNGLELFMDLKRGACEVLRRYSVLGSWRGVTVGMWSDLLYTLQNL